MLQSWILDLHLPVIGDVHLVTSLFFDIGVYLVVVGLVLDILRSLGAEIDRRAETGEDPVGGDAAGGDAEGDVPPGGRQREARRLGRGRAVIDMSPNIVLVVTIGVLFAAGVYLLLERSLSRVLIGVILIGNGANLLFLVAGGAAGRPPIVGDEPRGR